MARAELTHIEVLRGRSCVSTLPVYIKAEGIGMCKDSLREIHSIWHLLLALPLSFLSLSMAA
jgi:hypothetical protein